MNRPEPAGELAGESAGELAGESAGESAGNLAGESLMPVERLGAMFSQYADDNWDALKEVSLGQISGGTDCAAYVSAALRDFGFDVWAVYTDGSRQEIALIRRSPTASLSSAFGSMTHSSSALETSASLKTLL